MIAIKIGAGLLAGAALGGVFAKSVLALTSSIPTDNDFSSGASDAPTALAGLGNDFAIAGLLVGGVAVFTLGIALYLLPFILGRKRSDRTAILAMNVLLGWSLIGWAVAFIWAVMPERKTA